MFVVSLLRVQNIDTTASFVAPLPPKELEIIRQTNVVNLSRKRWRYRVDWQVSLSKKKLRIASNYKIILNYVLLIT